MAGLTSDLKFGFDDMDPNVLGEEAPSENQGITGQSEEGVAGDASVQNPINYNNDPSVSRGALTITDNFNPFLPIDDNNDPFKPSGALTTNDTSDPDHGHSLNQQVFQASVGFNPNELHMSETHRITTNVSSIEEEDWWKLTNDEENEAFSRLMEMSPEEFEKMMREFPDAEANTPGPSSATPYAISNKRVRCSEENAATISVGSAPSIPQPGFQPQQIHQIRQIREAKSRQGKAIEGLEKKVKDLEADLTKAHSEVEDAFQNGRMVALLGVEENWEAKEAKLRHDAEIEHERQIGVLRNFLEGQIAVRSKQLDQYQAEAEHYKTSVEREAERYKNAAEEKIATLKAVVEATVGAKDEAESSLSEKIKVLESAKPYVVRLETQIANLEGEKANWEAAERLQERNPQPPAVGALEGRIEELEAAAERTRATLGLSEKAIENLNEANQRAENARADLERLYKNSQSYASSLEIKLANFEKVQSSKEGAWLHEEEERKTLKNKIKILESTVEKAKRAKEETQSVVGPVEQVNIEPSTPASAKKSSTARPFTFVAAKEFPPSQSRVKPVYDQRQLRLRLQSQPLPQPQPEPETTPPSQWGMFSRQLHPTVPANRPRRIHIHAEEAIRNRFRIPLDKVHSITSKLDKIDDAQDGTEAADKAELVIAAELTGLSIRDLKIMRSLRMSFPGSSAKPRSAMASAQLEIPINLVELLASENRPAIRAFLDGASFPQSQASSDIARDVRSEGTQTEALDKEAEGTEENIAVQELESVVPSPTHSRWGSWLGVAPHWRILIFLGFLGLMMPLLFSLPWSSPVAWLFKNPDPDSG